MDIKGNVLTQIDIIPSRFTFTLVENNGIFSVYHRFDGRYGQRNFGIDRKQAEQHMEWQRICKDLYRQLLGKRAKLISRVAPISNKLDAVDRQIDALILR